MGRQRIRARTAKTGAVGIALMLALTGCADGSGDGAGHGGTHDMQATTTSASTASASNAARAGDVAFAQSMIPHHEQAVEMADLALAPAAAASQPVQGLAREIKAAQGPEISTMSGWLSQWGASVPTAGTDGHAGHGSMMGMMTAEQMDALEKASGAEFDQHWLTMMIAHHEGAVQMAQQVLRTTSDPQVKALAPQIVEAQQREIATMRGLLGGASPTT